jgi:DNA-binding IscR family transcriptional regulator
VEEIFSVIDGPDVAAREPQAARRPAAAVLEPVWERVRDAERAVLENTTVAQLAERSSPHDWTI